MKFLPCALNEENIVDILSDIKHRVFPRPFDRLAFTADSCNLTGVEVGVLRGAHALSLLKHLDIKMLYLIDPYLPYTDDLDQKRYGAELPLLKEAKCEAYEALRPYSDRISWIHKKSDDALQDIPDDLDFVYIDANHKEEYVWHDICNYAKKIKRGRNGGGVIGGHDFANGFQRGNDGVIKAVTRYALDNQYNLQVELPDWWIQLD